MIIELPPQINIFHLRDSDAFNSTFIYFRVLVLYVCGVPKAVCLIYLSLSLCLAWLNKL